MGLPKGILNSRKPFARLQFAMIAGLFILTGAYLTNQLFAATGSIRFVPTTSNVNIGSTVQVAIWENSGTDAINAVQADVVYDPTKLQYVGVSEVGSAFTIVAATQTSSGAVSIARGRAGGMAPVTGDQLVTTLTFKALSAGSTPLSFSSTSALVSSSANTNVLVSRISSNLGLSDTEAPAVPTGLAAPTLTMNGVGLMWSASIDNVATTGYRIYRNGVQVGTSTATNFTSTGLQPNTAYTFSVAAVDAAGNVSAQSTAISARTLADTQAPQAPGPITSPSQFITAITLTWTASTDNVQVTGYRVFRNGTQVGSPATASFNDQGLTPNTSYSYTVVAVDSSNNVSVPSAAASFRTLADTVAPSIPTGMVGTVNGANINLSWSAASDNIGVVGYIIYRDGVVLSTSLTPSFTVTNALTGTHTYTVAAVDAANNKSGQSSGVSLSIYDAADITRDGNINVFDLSWLLSNWSRTGVNDADINGDSVVNVFDLSILLSRWTG